MGGTGPRCPHGICDCFIDTHPENPGGLYPEDFTVGCSERGVSREEWRVTGEPGQGYPPYSFTFGSPTRLAMGEDEDPEASARASIAGIAWDDGPHLWKRTIIETPWEEVAHVDELPF
jgi:hypothetical protein